MQRTGLLLLLVFATCGGCPAYAADERGAKSDLAIHAVLRDLGVYELIRDVPQTINDGLEQRRREQVDRSASDWERISAVARTEFSEAAIARRIRAQLQLTYDDARYAVLQRLLQSAPAQRLLQAKREALTPKATEAIRALAKDHDSRTRDRDRMNLLEELDNASADTELFVAAQALAIHALVRLTDALDRSAPSMTQERKDALLNITYDQLLRPSKFTTTMTYLYAFETHSNDELGRYIDIYRFGDTQWLLRQIMQALNTAMEEATAEGVRQLRAAR